MNNIYKFSSIFLMSLFAFAGVYLLKITLNRLIPAGHNLDILLRSIPHIIFEAKFWLAIFCYGITMVIYLFLLQGDQVSKIFSIAVGVNILLTALGAVIFLGDTMNIPRMIGIILIVIGIFLINGF